MHLVEIETKLREDGVIQIPDSLCWQTHGVKDCVLTWGGLVSGWNCINKCI